MPKGSPAGFFRQVDEIAVRLAPFLAGVADFVVQVSRAPESPGYEPLLKDLGRGNFEARLWPYLIRYWGQPYADELNFERPAVIRKIRKLARAAGTRAQVARAR